MLGDMPISTSSRFILCFSLRAFLSIQGVNLFSTAAHLLPVYTAFPSLHLQCRLDNSLMPVSSILMPRRRKYPSQRSCLSELLRETEVPF